MTLNIIKILWILGLIINQIIIIIDVYRHMLIVPKHHFDGTLNGYSWMINPTYI